MNDDVIHSDTHGNHDNRNHPKAAGAPAVVYVFHKKINGAPVHLDVLIWRERKESEVV